MTAETPQFYSLRDLEELTGFDARTIYFYVQEGLVPKLGRRGRTSQYPQAFLDRLLFIKKLKALQDTGEIRPVTLRDIRRIMQTIPPDTVARVASGEEPLQAIELDEEREELHLSRFMAQTPVGKKLEDIPETEFSDLRQSILSLGGISETSAMPDSEDPGDAEEWTTLSVTDDILLTVRGKNAKITSLVQRLVRMIRNVVRMEG